MSTSEVGFETVSSNNGVFPLIIDLPFWYGPSDFKQFPVIPIPFCLRFQEGSAMMRLVSLKDLDPFSSLRSSMTETHQLSEGPRVSSPIEDSLKSSEEDRSVAPPKRNKRKCELASLMADASTICSYYLFVIFLFNLIHFFSFQWIDVQMSSRLSKKKVEKPVPKPKATAQSKTTVKVVEESRVSPESDELATPSYHIKRVRLPPCVRQTAKGKARQMEVLDIDEAETEKEVVPPPSKHRKSSKSAPTPSKASNFLPALLIDDQGRLKLPGDSVGEFTPFKRFEYARNSASLQCQNPIFDVNPKFLDLGAILTTQKASFTMQDLLQINPSIHDPSIPAQACVLALSQGEFTSNSSRLPGLKSAQSELCMQLDRLGTLFDQARQSFLRSFLDLQQAGQDSVIVLEALKAAEPQRESLSVEDWTVLATLFHWSSPFNLNGLKFDNRTPAEWIDLLRSIHSGTSSA
ncbi:hypothetical protein F5876DRAFT_82251 [Lentinula aff. lateritia]|uniref:Uncharacterized protein n=1 Tax=Lentinula aff. lateritia TaxID=2804960 RepID=A0ACC1TJZ8_9AGAR|nr:hypothetical protein F5876DRAFT_82251 [Lentinula aff. lateritia]